MQSDMANKLKNLLDNMSQEEFDQQWAAIEALEFSGLQADEVLEYINIQYNTTVAYFIVSEIETVSYSVSENLMLAA